MLITLFGFAITQSPQPNCFNPPQPLNWYLSQGESYFMPLEDKFMGYSLNFSISGLDENLGEFVN